MTKWEFYDDKAKEKRWRHIAENNTEIGAATEGFKNNEGCLENARFNGYPLVRITETVKQLANYVQYVYQYDFGTGEGWPRTSGGWLSDGILTEPIVWLLGDRGLELVEIKRAA